MNLVSASYAFTSAYLKGMESKCLSAGHIDGIFQKTTVQEALEVIKNTDIGNYLRKNSIQNFDESDEYLWKYLGECLTDIGRFKVPYDIARLSDVYMKKYDVLNTKIALRHLLTEKTAALIPLGTIHDRGYIKDLSDTESVSEIVVILGKCGLSDYASVIKDTKGKDRVSVLKAEIAMNRIYYGNMFDAMKKMNDGHILAKATGIIIDLVNLQMVFRFAVGEMEAAIDDYIIDRGYMLSGDAIKKLLLLKIPETISGLENTEYHLMAQDIQKNYENKKNVTVVDEIIEKHKLTLLKELLSPRILSTSNMLWYLILKELETRNLRIILKALTAGIPSSEIKDYLVTAS